MKNSKAFLRHILLLAFCISSNLIFAQSLVERAFVSMPEEFYLSLSKDMRKDMIINYLRDTSSVKKNIFKGESAIKEIDTTNNYMRIKNSEQATVEIKLLHANDSVIYIAVNFTACAPVCDSHLGFFAANWQLLKEPLMKMATIQDFLDEEKIKKENLKLEEIADKFDMALISYKFIDNGEDVEAVLNSEKLMDSDNYKRLKPYLKGDKIKYTWKKNKYEKTACYQ